MNKPNPMEECPPDELVTKLTIHATLQNRKTGGARTKGPLWKVVIPEIRYEGHSRSLTRLLAVEIARIEEANDELILGEQAYYKDPAKMIETARPWGEDHDAIQQKKLKDKWAHIRSFPEGSCDSPVPDRSHSIHCP